MRVKDIEIPLEEDRRGWYRFFEILPAVLTYSVLIAPMVLSVINPLWAAYYLVAYVLIWFVKALAMSRRALQGHARTKAAAKLDWPSLLKDLEDPAAALKKHAGTTDKMHKIHCHNLNHVAKRGEVDLKPDEIIHAVIIATYNESQGVIHPTVDSVLDAKVDNKNNVALFLAYEKRAGKKKEEESIDTVKTYKDKFMHAEAVGHEVQDYEVKGKGGNATWTGRKIVEWAAKNNIDPARILITTLDADNRPDVNYFAALTYSYIVADNRKQKSYQPIALYINNIWDTPALMRLSAVSNSFFHTGNAMRSHALRNFSAHTQSLEALIDTDFWSVRTIVEDGHQFWRTYFRYDGQHEVIPIYAPIYQDAVRAETYWRTLVAQFKQIRRWTYGASDIAYVATRAFFIPNKVPKWDALFKLNRLIENHVTWSTSSLLLVLAAWMPLLLNANSEENIVALQLPSVITIINWVGLVVIFASIYIGTVTLPPRPEHHKRTRNVAFLLQWVLIPVVGVIFNSIAAIYTQTRLAFRRYFEDFDVTEKTDMRQSVGSSN